MKINSFRSYRAHLNERHGIEFDLKGNSKSVFLCKETDCNSTFTVFSSFKRHYTQMHSGPQPNPSHLISTNIPFEPSENQVEMDQDTIPDEEMDTETDVIEPEMTLELGSEMVNRIICELRCKTNLTHSVVSIVVNMMLNIAFIISNYLRSQVKSLLRSMSIDLNSLAVVNLLNLFDVSIFFKNTDTFQKQLRHNLTHLNYVAPEEIVLGHRTDTVIQNNESTRKDVKESFQYLSLKSTLISLLRNKSFVKLLSEEKQSPPGIYKSYIDGQNHKKSNFFKKCLNHLRINLYYDDVEVTNPIGSQSSVYKIACFYYTIQNASSMFNSKLENIFVLAICYSTDLKKYGFEKILGRFIAEMKELESENGVTCYVGNQKKNLRATLVSFIGDTLAAHDILGFSGPGSSKFCRECMISRQSFNKNPISKAKKRTIHRHSKQLEKLKDSDFSPAMMSRFGLKNDSVLHCLRYFHCCTSNVFDPMHDLLEGVVPFTIKCVLKHFVKTRNLFTIYQFNDRLNNFRYGPIEKCNKPSPNFTPAMLNSNSKKLKQKSSQSWLLLRVFPFLVGNYLANSDFEYLDLLLTLSKICAIAFSTKLNDYQICVLDQLVKKYQTNFHKLFAEKNDKGKIKKGVTMINKQHHLSHYAQNIMEKGPIALYSCMRFEGKHLPIKKQIVNAQNFVNVPKSVMDRQSLLQSYNIKYCCFTKPVTMVTSCKMEQIRNTKSQKFIIEFFGWIPIVKIVKKCIVKGTEFCPNYVISIIDYENNTMHPTFVKIKEIFEHDNQIWFFCTYLNILEHSNLLNAFEIEESVDSILLKHSEIVDFHPVNIWKKYDSTRLFLNIKYCY